MYQQVDAAAERHAISYCVKRCRISAAWEYRWRG